MLDDIQVLGREGSLATTQNKVLRNTYALLGLTMIPTVIGALVGMKMNFAIAAQHPFMFAIGAMAVIYGMFFAINANRNSSIGVILLLALTFLLGLMLEIINQNIWVIYQEYGGM